MKDQILPVILSGGSGTRLWPLSRKEYPKQFLPLVSKSTMLQATLQRLDDLEELHASPVVVCNEEHRFHVASQFQQLGLESFRILLEPVGKNTAPALAIAALLASKEGEDPLMLVMPSDHQINDAAAFVNAVNSAVPLAAQGNLVTFGVIPSEPHTGYGYIEKGDAVADDAFKVKRFVEKPDAETAASYLDSGAFLWNSGIFLMRASAYLKELLAHAPGIHAACSTASEGTTFDKDFVRIAKDPFLACPSDSIDYAVMEKTDSAVVVPLEAGWSDVGSWSALWDVSEKDAEGNVLRGDAITAQTRNSLLHSEYGIVATVGVEDLIVVQTADAVLVASKEQSENIKQIVEKLESEGRSEPLLHRKVSRPWGTYDCIDESERFKVKRIMVKPGAKLSLQMHHHRAEHWIVVNGTAKVTRGDEEFILTENQSTYIPVGVTHSLENPGTIPLEIIEVQSGTYLGEDDIVRFEDRYGRA